jgi:HK97 family phage prohead protease
MTSKRQIEKEAPARRQWLDLKYVPATDFELKELGEKPDGYIAGWASTPDLDYYNHVVMVNAFAESIARKGLNGPKGIKLLIGHDRDKPAGAIRILETRGERLWIEAQLNLNISYVRDAYEAAKMVGGFSFSVGFYLEEYEFKQTPDKTEYLQINKGELEEISLVVFPGNPEAIMTYLKESNTDDEDMVFASIAELEKALVREGLVKSRNVAARLTQVVKKNLELFKPASAETPQPAQVAKEKINALNTLIGELKGLF